MVKRKRKQSKSSETIQDHGTSPKNGNDSQVEKDYIFSDELLASKKLKWINKQRVMILASRGITARDRHLMLNLRSLIVHSKSEAKLDSEKKRLFDDVNEICEARNCNKCVLFVNKKRKDSYVWFANVPKGPSAKFYIENINTMQELNLLGNCLKGSRPLLSFDPTFDSKPHLSLIKELFIQIFGIPHYHPKSQPFFDKVYTFSYLDNRIWFRNYQVISEEGKLEEIGPRFVLSLIKIFDGSFGGPVIFSNPNFVNPNIRRRMLRQQTHSKFRDKLIIREGREKVRARGEEYQDIDPLGSVFETIPPEEAKGSKKNIFRRIRN